MKIKQKQPDEKIAMDTGQPVKKGKVISNKLGKTEVA